MAATMKRIVLIAHDSRKKDMIEWARFNRDSLLPKELYATRSTGEAIVNEVGLPVSLLLHGPHGGDAQVGAMLAEGKVDLLVFLWDPLTPQPHDVDVKALLRLAVLHDVPTACNRRTADFLISSPLYGEGEEWSPAAP
ncbi:MAG: methylglyoxal synthase [Deltaproteobacteria bacterium]|nr:methylglyoxal synthase [Deltaproteobacteria bacterium]